MRNAICQHCGRTFDLSETDERIEYQYEHDKFCDDKDDDIETVMRLVEEALEL